MNIFATIKVIDTFTFKKVKYYSVQFEEKEVNEFLDFLNRMENIEEIKEDLNFLFIWLEEIGDNYGALPKFFRHEGSAEALPPPAHQMKLTELEIKEQLRLYCLRANEHIVFLFNGGVKTENKAQDCPNVSVYFRQANQLAKAINQLFKDRCITWNHDQTDIVFDTDLKIEL